jgi:hypothetical protein
MSSRRNKKFVIRSSRIKRSSRNRKHPTKSRSKNYRRKRYSFVNRKKSIKRSRKGKFQMNDEIVDDFVLISSQKDLLPIAYPLHPQVRPINVRPIKTNFSTIQLQGLEQSQICIISKHNKTDIFYEGKEDRDCKVNMCFFYALYHVWSSHRYSVEMFLRFLNFLSIENLITGDKAYTSYIEITDPRFIRLLDFLSKFVSFVTIQDNLLCILKFIDDFGMYAFVPLKSKEQLVYIVHRFPIVALVQGKHRGDDKTGKTNKQDHFIGINIDVKDKEVEIIDSIYKHRKNEATIPIDRLKDNQTKRIIDEIIEHIQK